MIFWMPRIAHECGHCIEDYIAMKRRGLLGAILGDLQKSAIQYEKENLGMEYFLHMGFEEETTEEIYAIIKDELGGRAIVDTSEMVAQAFAQVQYGTKPVPHAKKLVEYVLSLAR